MDLISFHEFESLPRFTPESQMRILVSACLSGKNCGVDGTSNGDYPWIRNIMSLPNVEAITFCPEDFSFGTPRDMPDIHGGNGFDVLDGKAKVLSNKNKDMTEGMISAAKKMLELAQSKGADLAILMDMSAACGTQVISDGCRLVENRKYQKGPGVCAAILLRAGFKVVSQRDYKTLEKLKKHLNPKHVVDSSAKDHHETDWYKGYFG